MNKISIQNTTSAKSLPTRRQFLLWVNQVIGKKHNYEVSIRIVDIKEITKLNKKYRKKDKATNIISFPFEPPPTLKTKLLGDLVICASIVQKEAKALKKPAVLHWAHLTIHGVLHLLGYDHKKPAEAATMEKLEIKHLKQLGIANPYLDIP